MDLDQQSRPAADGLLRAAALGRRRRAAVSRNRVAGDALFARGIRARAPVVGRVGAHVGRDRAWLLHLEQLAVKTLALPVAPRKMARFVQPLHSTVCEGGTTWQKARPPRRPRAVQKRFSSSARR